MRQFEYRVQFTEEPEPAGSWEVRALEDSLRRTGREGWELVAVIPRDGDDGFWLFFKRELQNSA